MKKIIIIICIFTFFVGCQRTYNVIVKKDEFTKAISVKLDMWHEVMEGSLDNTRLIYEKQIKNGKPTPTIARLDFRVIVHAMTGYSGESLDNEAFVLIGDKNFKVKLINKGKNIQNRVSGSGSTNAAGDYSADVSTVQVALLNAKIVFNKKMERAIKNANILKIRVSTGGNPTVLKATEGQLIKVKEFFATKGLPKQQQQ